MKRVNQTFVEFQKMVVDSSTIERHFWVLRGLSVREARTALLWFTNIPTETVLAVLGIRSSAVPRKRLLNRQQSASLLALVEIAFVAEKILGTHEQAETWLISPALALDGSRPIDLLTTSPGQTAVKDFLRRIDHSVYT